MEKLITTEELNALYSQHAYQAGHKGRLVFDLKREEEKKEVTIAQLEFEIKSHFIQMSGLTALTQSLKPASEGDSK